MTAEGTKAKVTDVTLAHTDVPAALSPFSYVAPADLVLFLGITVMLLASGVVETRRLGLMARISAAPVRRRTVVAALIATSLCVAAAQSAGLLLVGRVLFGVHWGNAVGRLPRPGHAVARLCGRSGAGEHALAHRGTGDLGRRGPRHPLRVARRAACTPSTWWGRPSAPWGTPCRRPGPWTPS